MKRFDVILFAVISTLLVSAYFLLSGWDMREILVSGLLAKIISALLAIFFVRILLSLFDAAAGVSFSKWLEKADTRDEAIYYACRYLGTCLLFGMIIG